MVIRKKDEDIRGTAMTYRPDVKVLDCTVRDGSLINDGHFDDDFVRAVYETNLASGVDYMEFGYKASKRLFSPEEFGPWKFSAEEDIRRIVGDNDTDLKISVMADVDRADYKTDILPADESVIDMVRVACYIHQIPGAIDMVRDARDKGYETTINLMAISTVGDRELEEGLDLIVKSPVDVVYLVDSFGSLYFQPIRDLALTYVKAAESQGKTVGIHAHNNQQLAFANTVEAMVLGVSLLDATINGMGRGAGNCPMEMLLGFLKNPKFKQRPVLQTIRDVFVPMREKMRWGYDIPYMLTGQMNQHPRSAIQFLDGDNPTDYVAFYDEIEEC